MPQNAIIDLQRQLIKYQENYNPPMVDSFTLHSLVRFVYQESCEAENLQLTELAKRRS